MKPQYIPLTPLPGADGHGPLIIAGPCSAESRTQIDQTARALNDLGVKALRAGVWKPRTHPGGFEGIGAEALDWLAEAKRNYSMAIATEVAMARHVEEAYRAGVDIMWIGARTSVNPFAVQEIADALEALPVKPAVLVKNPVNPDLELWIGAIQRISKAGVTALGAIHRGFTAYGNNSYRNPPHWSIPFELRRRLPGLPVICDPSHITGCASMVAPTASQAIGMGLDGLIVEVHPEPEKALSDSAQQLTPAQFADLLANLPVMGGHADSDATKLDDLRVQIDHIDDEIIDLIARRMAVAAKIGRLKHMAGMPVLQSQRYNSLMNDRIESAVALGLDADAMRRIFAALHEESVRLQLLSTDGE